MKGAPYAQPYGICPEESSGCFSRLNFGWIGPMLKRESGKLEMSDIWTLHDKERASTLHTLLTQHREPWRPDMEGLKGDDIARARRSQLVGWLWKIARPHMLPAAGAQLCQSCCQLAQPLFLRAIVLEIEQGEGQGYARGVGFAFALFGVSLLMSLSAQAKTKHNTHYIT
jgi:hypothetical protein